MPSHFFSLKDKLPALGVGLGLRKELAEETLSCPNSIDWLEIAPENFMGIGGRARDLLERAAAIFPVVCHGLNLSIGSTDNLNEVYLRQLKTLLDMLNVPWWSDHLCFSSAGGVYMHDLLPLPFNRQTVSHVAERVRRVQDYIERPFLLENISFYMHTPGCRMSEAQFISEVLEEADCGLLLDVNNIYVNSINHKFDPYRFIDEIPVERTVQIHIAGHKRIGDYIIDTHGEPVIQPVYKLLEHVLEQTSVKAVMIERDQNFPDFDEILNELDHLRGIIKRTARPSSAQRRKAACA